MIGNLFYNFFLIYKILERHKSSYKQVFSYFQLHIPSEKMEGCGFCVKKRHYIASNVCETEEIFETKEDAVNSAKAHTLEKESNNAVVIKITPNGIRVNICLFYCVPNCHDEGYTLAKYTN